MKQLLSLLFFSSYYFSCAQSQINFILCNQDKEPISYVTVYAKKSQKGTYSNLSGKVSFAKILDNDTLVITCLGYEKIEVSSKELTDTLFLNPFSQKLEEFTLKSEYEREVIGIKRKNFLHSVTGGNYAGNISGIVFPEVKKSQLESVSLFIEKSEDSSRIQFRLMVYEVCDTSSFPTKAILKKQLTFDVSEVGWSKISVDSFNLQIEGRLFIGLETIPNYTFDDAPEFYEWTKKPSAQYKSISFLFTEKPLTLIRGISGHGYTYGLDGTENGAHNNFPLIKATIKY